MRQLDINYIEHKIAWQIARKNLLARIDRQFFSVDSYFLNMEIMVDTLAEILFYKLEFSQANYQRGYARPMDYINQRLQNQFPHSAKSSENQHS